MARARELHGHAETCLARSGGPKILFRKQKLRSGLLCGSGLRCVALRSVIAVAGKFASILFCGLAA